MFAVAGCNREQVSQDRHSPVADLEAGVLIMMVIKIWSMKHLSSNNGAIPTVVVWGSGRPLWGTRGVQGNTQVVIATRSRGRSNR